MFSRLTLLLVFSYALLFSHLSVRNDCYLFYNNEGLNTKFKNRNFAKQLNTTTNNKSLNIAQDLFINFIVFQNKCISRLKVNNTSNLEKNPFSLFDISGRRVLRKKVSLNKESFKYSTNMLSDGVYIAKINLTNNQGYSKKIIVTNR